MKPYQWSLFRWFIALTGLVVEVRVLIPDYPWGVPFWKVACWDANGWLHEAFYIAVGFLVLIDLAYRWEEREVRARVRRIRSGRDA